MTVTKADPSGSGAAAAAVGQKETIRDLTLSKPPQVADKPLSLVKFSNSPVTLEFFPVSTVLSNHIKFEVAKGPEGDLAAVRMTMIRPVNTDVMLDAINRGNPNKYIRQEIDHELINDRDYMQTQYQPGQVVEVRITQMHGPIARDRMQFDLNLELASKRDVLLAAGLLRATKPTTGDGPPLSGDLFAGKKVITADGDLQTTPQQGITNLPPGRAEDHAQYGETIAYALTPKKMG